MQNGRYAALWRGIQQERQSVPRQAFELSRSSTRSRMTPWHALCKCTSWRTCVWTIVWIRVSALLPSMREPCNVCSRVYARVCAY